MGFAEDVASEFKRLGLLVSVSKLEMKWYTEGLTKLCPNNREIQGVVKFVEGMAKYKVSQSRIERFVSKLVALENHEGRNSYIDWETP